MDNETETVSLNDEEGSTSDDPRELSSADFPEQAFTGLFKTYLDLVGPCTEAPSVYHWVTCLTMIGLLLGRNVFIRSPFPLYPNFYSLLIGPTGINRKSTAMTFGVREILSKVQHNIVYIPGALSSEGIYEQLSKRPGCQLLLYCDEMRSLLNVAGRQGTADILPRLNSLYGCPDTDGLTRRGSSTKVEFPFVSLIAGTPKEWLTSAISDGEIMGGFVNRFLCVDGVSTKDIPFTPQPSPDASRHFIEQVNKVIDLCSLPFEMKWSAEAQMIYEKFYSAWRQRQRSRPEETAAITNRITDHVVKIAMMYSVSDEKAEITDNAIATAIQIGDYLERTAISVFGDLGISRQGRVEQMILGRLKSAGGIMEYRKLQRALGGKTDAESFVRAIKNLITADVIKVLPPKTTTPPTPRMVVHLGD